MMTPGSNRSLNQIWQSWASQRKEWGLVGNEQVLKTGEIWGEEVKQGGETFLLPGLHTLTANLLHTSPHSHIGWDNTAATYSHFNRSPPLCWKNRKRHWLKKKVVSKGFAYFYMTLSLVLSPVIQNLNILKVLTLRCFFRLFFVALTHQWTWSTGTSSLTCENNNLWLLNY